MADGPDDTAIFSKVLAGVARVFGGLADDAAETDPDSYLARVRDQLASALTDGGPAVAPSSTPEPATKVACGVEVRSVLVVDDVPPRFCPLCGSGLPDPSHAWSAWPPTI